MKKSKRNQNEETNLKYNDYLKRREELNEHLQNLVSYILYFNFIS